MKKMSLCEGRHQFPDDVEGSIFPSVIDPLDTGGLEAIAGNMLGEVKRLHLYVTGLSVALVAVMNVCQKRGIELILWHYNRDNKEYYPQGVYNNFAELQEGGYL